MNGEPSAFRLAERKYKYYKSSKEPPNYSDVFDFHSIERNTNEMQKRIVVVRKEYKGRMQNVYSLIGVHGFFFIPGILNVEEQAYWSSKSVFEYPDKPNYSNFGGMLQDNVWETHCSSKDSIHEPKSRINKLRWVTLGYHYNWTTNIYEDTKERISEFPSELVSLASEHANLCGFSTYEPQAGIVNYYHSNMSMMKAHQDESEFTFNQPILSYSIGCSCIFLLGNTSTDNPPIPIFMRSGDLMIMGGHSRVFYHGVARIISNTCPEELLQQMEAKEETRPLVPYLQKIRINLNIRQMFPTGQNKFLTNEERKQLLLEAMQRAEMEANA